MSTADLALWASIVSALVSIVGFPLVIAQLMIARQQQRKAIQLTTSQTLLSLDAVLASYSDVASKLSSSWAHPNEVNPTAEEFPKVNPYVGLFERAYVAHKVGQVDVPTLRALYDYRLWNIWNNHRIVEDVLQNAERRGHWDYFLALTILLEADRGCRYPLHNDDYYPTELLAAKGHVRLVEKHRAIPNDARDPFSWSWLNKA